MHGPRIPCRNVHTCIAHNYHVGERPLAEQGAQCGVLTRWITGGMKTDAAACGNMLNHTLPDSGHGKHSVKQARLCSISFR